MATWLRSVGQMDALLGGDDVIAVEVGGPLLEFGEIFDRPQRPLRAVDLLVVQPPKLTVSSRNRAACGRVSGFR